MTDTFAKSLLYLDSEFISRLYEQEFNVTAPTQITRTDSVQASASIAFFSGGGNSSESRTYSVSPTAMLKELTSTLDALPSFEELRFALDQPSAICWVEGSFGTTTLEVTRNTHTIRLIGAPDPEKHKPKSEFIDKETYFSLKASSSKFALSTTDHYFTSGLAGLKGLTNLVIDRFSLPCRALLRVISANTSHGEWIAIPLLIYDRH
jgi:hypothetical protein